MVILCIGRRPLDHAATSKWPHSKGTGQIYRSYNANRPKQAKKSGITLYS